MKMLTKEIEKNIPALYATDGQPDDVRKIAAKFFTPWANWTWYVFEGEKQANGDWEFFGLVDGNEKEVGYFMLSQLTEIRGPAGLRVERDRHFDNKTVADL